jgi:hypothetical protein
MKADSHALNGLCGLWRRWSYTLLMEPQTSDRQAEELGRTQTFPGQTVTGVWKQGQPGWVDVPM